MLQAGYQPVGSTMCRTAACQGRRAAQRALVVLCSGPGNGGPPRLSGEEQRRALGVLSGARLFDWRQVGSQLGGTLIVDDASHKEEVQKVSRPKGARQPASLQASEHRGSHSGDTLPMWCGSSGTRGVPLACAWACSLAFASRCPPAAAGS